MRSIPLLRAGRRVARIERTLHARGEAPAVTEDELERALHGAGDDERAAGRRFWSQRAWSEYAAVPAHAEVLVKGVGERAPLDESAALAAVVRDETEHTRLAQDVAEALGGYEPDVPDELAFDPYAFVEPTSLPRVADVVLAGCLGESVSRALLQASLPFTAPAALRSVVARVHEDECAHVALAWALAEDEIPALDARARRDLARLAAPHVRAARDGTLGRASSMRAQARQAKLFDDVAAAGLGCAPATVVEEAIARVFVEQIVPSLARLGVPVEAEGGSG